MNIYPAKVANQMHYFAATARAFPICLCYGLLAPDFRMTLRAYENTHHTSYKPEVYLILILHVTADRPGG